MLAVYHCRLLYEKVGSYLLKKLVELNLDEEIRFREKCEKIYQLSQTDRDAFNQLFSCDIPDGLNPKMSYKILRVMSRCQLPYEMFHTLYETA